MIRTVITGSTGRMGSTLLRLARDAKDLQVVGATVRPGSPVAGQDAGLAARLGAALDVLLMDDLDRALEFSKADVVVDFTGPQASLAHAKTCAERGVPLVVGSTGFTEDDSAALRVLARKVPIVAAPNMSVGVNLIIGVAAELARVLGPSFDVEVLEAHHRMKKDAPSGTALKLAEVLAEALGRTRDDLTFVRDGQTGARPPGEIGVQALRGGDVVGEHTVYFFGEGERIELTHRATNRDQFAQGALRAARWVARRAPGLYDMADVLGLQGKT
ncbi:4-hydroxy-tetrahydrodipicolinate reductase [Corallococcus praedator]|uniref:4-hydroxy-tetrahydrodipicolinate reductase n=1 Tax=Corallococcus praedator TaxID=2316724 RepID=A0ABX9Q5S2_9BACT|nr:MULTISPECIES: 4-hydroxy-tetrahydrodipicolinate reductase [Corallococcus]RKH06709.1 4-hydroxy-tetrahydrodipicolinate reductase [Corallococcus sp. CA047B]RKH22747.1 4-hydroxy-tetrahydrodipicolinate reductase [Corallococcus sp. CA031C]RKH91120.1 4-hydroxy-tetrahydrodipicolinate reductase [Corallococcus praedator]